MIKIEKVFRKIYDKVMNYASKENSWKFLSFISFIESIFFPLPTDLFLIPLILANRSKFFFLIMVTIIFSVLGGLAGYLLGFYFWEAISSYLVNFYPSFEENFINFSKSFNEFGWFIVLIGGFTPLPFKVVTISSGFMQLDILSFIFFSFVSRGARFFLVGFLFYKYGEKIRSKVETNIHIISLILVFLFTIYLIIKLYH